MDSLDLLAREDEFKKLNEQLEKKTESLMKEIEHVMQKQDFFADFSHSLTFNSKQSQSRKHCCDPPKSTPSEQTNTQVIQKPLKKRNLKSPNCTKQIEKSKIENISDDSVNDATSCVNCAHCTKRIACDCCSVSKYKNIDDIEFLHAFVSVNVQEKVLPQSFLKDSINVESICKFLSSKVKLMQEQMDKLQTMLDNKAAQCKVHLTIQAELEGERMSLLNNSQKSRTAAADAKAKCSALENRLADKDRLYKEQRSEADKLLSEVKRLRSKNANVEAKCSTQVETIESLKQQLEVTKRTEKEFRDSSRSLSASHQNAISGLEERVKSLTVCIDKQAALVDNLRRQNAILSTDGAVKALEREYCNFLTQD
ncbi:uncharacterized protein ACR2FA_010902 [Aphomia sociella]